MSIFSAMISAVSGLKAQGHALGHISDNLANTSTVGYKRVETRFQNLVTASSSQVHSPGGVLSVPSRNVLLQGSIDRSDQETNLALNGQGFFSVSKATVWQDGTRAFDSNYYTRAGDFSLDREGYLVNSAGFFLNGWPVTDPANLAVNPNAEPIQINRLSDTPAQTTYLKYRANLPANANVLDDTNTATPDIEYSPSQMRVYDPLGNERDLMVQWIKEDPSIPGNENLWRVEVSVAGGDLTGTAGGTDGITRYVRFHPSNAGSATPGTVEWIDADPAGPGVPPNSGTPAGIPLSITEADGSSWDFDLRFGEHGQLGGLTQYASQGIELSRTEQDGVPLGSLEKVTVDANGFVILNYNNGRSLPVYKIPVALFSAPNALQAVAGTAFSATFESGPPTLVSAGDLGAGEVVPMSLEASNVDIGHEFSRMIITQRAYSANARVVTVSDGMLQEAVNLVR